MLLSDGIRLGAAMKPQAFGDYYHDGGSCALGAAHDARQLAGEDGAVGKDYWFGQGEACPACETVCVREKGMIPHLNDDKRWSREAIADWVESIEIKKGLKQAQAKPIDPLADIFSEAECDKETVRCV